MSKCEYCNDCGDGPTLRLMEVKVEHPFFEADHALGIDIFYPNKMSINIYDYIVSREINYCPMCGRKLNPKALEEAADGGNQAQESETE